MDIIEMCEVYSDFNVLVRDQETYIDVIFFRLTENSGLSILEYAFYRHIFFPK